MKLDQSVPFVRQVHAFMHGVGSAEACVETLRRHEEKWGIEHVAPAFDVYVEDYTVKTRGPARFSHIIGLPEGEAFWQPYVVERYYGFLSETHLIFETCWFGSSYDIVFSNEYSFQATARAWAAMYARWANGARWLGKSEWDYKDFYGALVGYIDDYEPWAKAAYEVIERKTAQYPST